MQPEGQGSIEAATEAGLVVALRVGLLHLHLRGLHRTAQPEQPFQWIVRGFMKIEDHVRQTSRKCHSFVA